MKALYHLFLQGTGSYADATKLPASTPDDDVVVTAVLKKELLSPKKSQGNGAFNKRFYECFYFHWCQIIDKIAFFHHQYHLFHNDDREEIVSTRRSEESADEDSTPKESTHSKVSDRTKRRRPSSVRFSRYGIK